MAEPEKQTRKLYSISQLNHLTKQLLEDAFPPLWVEGEISNLSAPSSGHLYFTLKDEQAQVRCAMFRHKNRAINFKPEHGTHVHALVQVSLYEGRGDYQLIIDVLEEAGDGIFQKRFEALKKQLHSEGLFAEALKQSIPTFPQCIGVISSTTGAAVRDVLSVHRRRFPSIPVVIYPTPVQGEEAALKIVAAIQRANDLKHCDVLLLIRGGGSLEDLWSFNEEIVARAVFNSVIPVISGVGHEIDFTIADFVADKRAATPTAAAELVTPDRAELQQQIGHIYQRLQQKTTHALQHSQHQLQSLHKRLRHPGERLQELVQRVDHAEQKLKQSWQVLQLKKMQQFSELKQKLQQHSPQHKLAKFNTDIENISQRLHQNIINAIKQKQLALANITRALDAVSPLNTLSRGYAIARKGDQVLTKANQVAQGDNIQVTLQKGNIDCTVD